MGRHEFWMGLGFREVWVTNSAWVLKGKAARERGFWFLRALDVAGWSEALSLFRCVGSKLKCPVFVASEMSGFKVVPSPIGLG
jgi:hypothetical protein